MGATREESHALATVLREDDITDHKPIRRGQCQPCCILSLPTFNPLQLLQCSPDGVKMQVMLLEGTHNKHPVGLIFTVVSACRGNLVQGLSRA